MISIWALFIAAVFVLGFITRRLLTVPLAVLGPLGLLYVRGHGVFGPKGVYGGVGGQQPMDVLPRRRNGVRRGRGACRFRRRQDRGAAQTTSLAAVINATPRLTSIAKTL